MRLSMALMSVLAMVFARPASSAPILYNINFQYTFGGETQVGEAHSTNPDAPPPTPAGLPVALPTGSFYYDPDAPVSPYGIELYQFSNPNTGVGEFQVLWGISDFNISNYYITGSPACADGQTGDSAVLNLLTNCPSATWWGDESPDFWGSFTFQETDANGSISVTGTDWDGYDYPAGYSGGTFQAVDPQAVPEPSIRVLMLVGLAFLLAARTRRWRAALSFR
jgi:hypothetical protein